MNSNTDRNPAPRLEGKVAVVSGAGTYGGSGVGNGAAVAILMAREGAKVVLVDAESSGLMPPERSSKRKVVRRSPPPPT